MKQKKFFSLPVTFTEVQGYSFDNSLIPVDIKVMHDGLNFNNSTFFDEAIESAKESLKNKPILGYIKKTDGSDEIDFSGHEVEIVFGEDGLKVVYLERPLGTIPESNNYAIQEEGGKKYVCCRGYLWKEYLNNGYQILKDNPKKSVSMEIAVDDYEENDDGTINITKYRYLGITVLGDLVSPAMAGAELNVIGQFSERFSKEFYEKIEELNNNICQFSLEGGETVENNQLKTEEVVVEEANFEKVDESIEVEVKAEEEYAEDKIELEDQVTEEKFVKVFELSHDDIRSKLYGALRPLEEELDTWFWIIEVYDNYFIYVDEINNKYYKQNYIKTDVDVALDGDGVEVFAEYLTAEEIEVLKQQKEEFELLKQEVIGLKEYKSSIEKAQTDIQKDELFEQFGKALKDVPEFEQIKEQREDFSVEEIETKLALMFAQKSLKFSKADKKDTSIKLSIEDKDLQHRISPYGDLF